MTESVVVDCWSNGCAWQEGGRVFAHVARPISHVDTRVVRSGSSLRLESGVGGVPGAREGSSLPRNLRISLMERDRRALAMHISARSRWICVFRAIAHVDGTAWFSAGKTPKSKSSSDNIWWLNSARWMRGRMRSRRAIWQSIM